MWNELLSNTEREVLSSEWEPKNSELRTYNSEPCPVIWGPIPIPPPKRVYCQ